MKEIFVGLMFGMLFLVMIFFLFNVDITGDVVKIEKQESKEAFQENLSDSDMGINDSINNITIEQNNTGD